MLKFLLVVLLYILSLYLIIVANVLYMIGGDLSEFLNNNLFYFAVPGVALIYMYLISVLIRGVKKEIISRKYMYGFLAFFPLIIVFYFGYFSVYSSENVPEKQFETHLQNIEVPDRDNGYVQLEKLLEVPIVNHFLVQLKNEGIHNRYNCLLKINTKPCQNSIKTDNKKDNNSEFEDIVKKSLSKITSLENFKQFNQQGKIYNIKGISTLSKQNLFVIIKYLESGEQKKAIESLLLFQDLGDKILQGDSSLVGMILAMTLHNTTHQHIHYILEHHELSQTNLEKLQKRLSGKQLNEKEIFSNTLNVEYQMFKNGFTTGINKGQIRSSLIFNIDELFNERRKYIQDVKEGKDVLNREIPPLYTREFLYYLVGKYFSYPGYESYSTVLGEGHEIRTAILERIKKKM